MPLGWNLCDGVSTQRQSRPLSRAPRSAISVRGVRSGLSRRQSFALLATAMKLCLHDSSLLGRIAVCPWMMLAVTLIQVTTSGCCDGMSVGPDQSFPVSGVSGSSVTTLWEGRFDARIQWMPAGYDPYPDESALDDFPLSGETGLHLELVPETRTWHAPGVSRHDGACELGAFTMWAQMHVWTDDGGIDDTLRVHVAYFDSAPTVRPSAKRWRAFFAAYSPRERPAGSLEDYDPRTESDQVLSQVIEFSQSRDGVESFFMTLAIEADGFGERRVVAALVE